MDPISDSDQDCLCLLCRKIGHVVGTCPLYPLTLKWPGDLDSTSSSDAESSCSSDVEVLPPSPPFDPFPITEESTQALCERCSQLEELMARIEDHHPIVAGDVEADDFTSLNKQKIRIPPLGPVRSLRLLSTCPLCCLIGDISDLADEELDAVRDGCELVLVTGWTIHRLEMGLCWEECERGGGPYAKCMYTSMTTQFVGDGAYRPRRLVREGIDAIGLLDIEEGRSNDTPSLGVKRVDPQTPDYGMIKGWLHRCDELHHTTCRPLAPENLKRIKLVDVETRQIVKYPPDGCDYIALSYVWGCVEQHGYKLEDILPIVPATLEDAIVVTRNLGKQYLWADSSCIDQQNSTEKDAQIVLMSTIYSGAWATIICLSGKSACCGLPRVGTLQGVVPQRSYNMCGKTLLSVMPTLDQQISWSTWGSRGWTYQEGLLSPRRLFFTNHQVYFECNSVQCCESLDDSSSLFHLQTDEQRLEALDGVVQRGGEPESVLGSGVSRDPFRPISSAAEAQVDFDSFATYQRLVNDYTGREMSHDADSLNAFSAVLTRLEEKHYKGGFLHGLPVDDLPRALLWFRHTPLDRRGDFPAWSWAGWDGKVPDFAVHGAGEFDNAVMPPLRIWKAGCDGQPELVYDFNPAPYLTEEPKELSEKEDNLEDKPDYEVDEGGMSPFGIDPKGQLTPDHCQTHMTRTSLMEETF